MPHMKRLLFLFLLSFGSSTMAQIGGNSTFSFLDLSYNARSVGVSGDFISVMDDDIDMGVSNPSLLNKKHHQHLSFNQAFLPSGFNYGMVNYGRAFKKDITGAAHLRYVDYGNFVRRDEIGNELGTFHPLDLIVGFSASKPFGQKLSVGTTLNFINSQIESYSAFGMSLDLAGTYYNEDKEFLSTFLVKNAGYQFKGYTKKNHEPLPVELQMSFSKKLAHAPFRFALLAHHLNTWDLTYNDPNAQPTIDALTGDTIPVKRANAFEKSARHLSYQVEILISKNIHLRSGFDYHRRQELKVEAKPGAAGFSFGTSLLFKKFRVDYGFSIYSKAGFQHMITLQTDFSKWRN